MPSSCVVPFCSEKTGGHKFPRDKILREKWITAIRRVNFVPSEYSIVCKKHFNKDDYRLPKESMLKNPTLVLKKDSIPSNFSWNDKNTGVTKRKAEKRQFISQRCSVLQCKSGSSKNVILHTCPNQDAIRKKWAEVFKVKKEFVKNMLICSQHFLQTDYINSRKGESRILKQNAVPSQKLPRSTRLLNLRKKTVHEKKKIRPKNLRRAEKMTEVVNEETKVDHDEEIRECRTCLKKMEDKTSVCNIFQTWVPQWAGMEATIAEDLAKLANVEVLDTDTFPQVICEPCYQKLLDASTFAANVRFCDKLLRERHISEVENTDKVWPKPIQVDKNINGNVFQEMDLEIKKEILSDEEYDTITAESSYGVENSYVEPELANLEIKIEPEEIIQPSPLQITINGTMSLNPLCAENKTLVNGTDDYEAIITDGVEHTALMNGMEDTTDSLPLDATVKEEPLSEEEDQDMVPGLSLECMLCTKIFNSVSGLKAHVIAQHSYKSVKRKTGGAESPEKKLKDEHRCQICRRTFTTSTDLMVHETCHNKHSCYVCSRKFDTFKQLSKHRKRCRVPLSKTVLKPKTLDDVIRPVKDEKMDTSDIEHTSQEDSNDGNMKLHLEIHSTSSESHTVKTITDDSDKHIQTVNKDCT